MLYPPLFSRLRCRALWLGPWLLLAAVARADDASALADAVPVHGSAPQIRPMAPDPAAAPAPAPVDSPAPAPAPADVSSSVGPINPTLLAQATPDSSPADASGGDPAAAPPPPLIDSPGAIAANLPMRTGPGPSPEGGPPAPPADAPPARPEAPPSPNVTVNLLNLMVKRNLISREDADELIRQAQQEADVARAQAASTQATAERALTVQQAAPAAAPAPAPANGDDEVRVTYVPDIVKQQITDQVTQNVMEETREEHIADTIAAREVPDWVKRFHVGGDVRVRYEDDQYPGGNAVGNFTNFNAINTGTPFNFANPGFPPQYNADQDRQRYRLRARIGAEVDLGAGFTSGIRIATGNDNTPTTENQTFGLANGAQGGDFSKYNIWLDRAFIRYELGGTPDKDLSVTIGRFDNPFFSTTMLWADDLGFDGIAVKGSYQVVKGVTPFLTGGAFPIFNTDFNFSSDQSSKFQSEDKYLFAVQGGARWAINKDFNFTGAAAYYDFDNVQGKVSDPIPLEDANDDISGNTDDSRPSFAQNGNTYIALRNYTGAAAIGPDQFQFFGLASQFQVLAITGQLDFSHFDPFHISLTGEFIKNLAFDRQSIIDGGPAVSPGPQNNTTSADPNSFDGGDTGYLVHLDFGKPVLQQLWDWNVRVSYRYVETDATVDAFTDSDFGAPLLGTNLKGYTVGGNLAFSSRVWAGLRYMSADNVSGPTFRNDLIQFDLNAKF